MDIFPKITHKNGIKKLNGIENNKIERKSID
jgi:hypothetical protein